MSTGAIADIFGAIALVKGPLTFWAFSFAILALVLIQFLRGTAFHRIWARAASSTLDSDRFFRLLRVAVVGVLVVSLVTIALAFAAPLVLKRLEVDEQRGELQSLLATYATTLTVSENPKVLAAFDEAMAAFKAGEYTQARRRLIILQGLVSAATSAEAIQGLITATYYAHKEHVDGLKFICAQYANKPERDVRFRYQIHAHMRRIALHEGYDDAENIVRHFKAACRRADFSYIWAGIPLKKIEDLVQDGRVTIVSDGPDASYLRFCLERYPNDPFLDHAYFFLGRYQELVDRFPNSMLIDVALAESVYQNYAKKDYNATIQLAKRYLERFPRGNDVPHVVAALGRTYLESRRFDDALQLSQHYSENDSEPDAEMPRYVSGFAYARGVTVTSVETLRSALGDFAAARVPPALFSRFLPDSLKSMDALAREGKTDEAQSEFVAAKTELEQRGAAVPATWLVYDQELREFNAAARGATPAQLFALGLKRHMIAATVPLWFDSPAEIARERAQALVALAAFRKSIQGAPSSATASRARYLVGASLRRSGRWSDAAGEFSDLVSKTPMSELADDALAELVHYELEARNDLPAATRYLDLLKKDYAARNATDNALYIIGNYHLKNRRYSEALGYYTEVATRYTEHRLGQSAQQLLAGLSADVATVAERQAIPGVKFFGEADEEQFYEPYVSDIERGTPAEQAGFQLDDKIVQVAGNEVQTIADYYRALMHVSANKEVEVVVRRGFTEQSVTLNAQIGKEPYFPDPPSSEVLDFKKTLLWGLSRSF